MSRRPLIAISPSSDANGAEFDDASVSVSHCYSEAIIEAGGLPMIVPCFSNPELVRETMERCDGLLLTGGDDLQPGLYTARLPEQLSARLGPTDGQRDLLELLLVSETFRQKKPLLGICRGQQILNVAFGGTLFVDLFSELGGMRHDRATEKDELVHDISITRGSMLEMICGKNTLRVNSCHHQAVKDVAAMFVATARSSDGVVEALELKPEHRAMLPFFLAVQFHPERLTKRFETFGKLFHFFVGACRAPESKV